MLEGLDGSTEPGKDKRKKLNIKLIVWLQISINFLHCKYLNYFWLPILTF
jgi:hypothetical protein